MAKYRRILILSSCILFFTVICIAILGVVFLSKYNASQEQANRITSVYGDSKIDFIIPSPSKDQIEEMGQLDHIEEVFPLRSVYTELSLKQKNLNSYVLLLDNYSDLQSTMFRDSRVLKQREELNENSILIDETFAAQYNLSLGDEVVWNISSTESVRLVVDAIYYKNVLDDVRVIAFNLGAQKEIIDRLTKNNPIKISGAYINSSDDEKTDEMLKTYQPLGRLKTPEDFDFYTEYEEYLEDFNEVDYYKQIIKTNNYKLENEQIAEKYQKEANKSIVSFVLLTFASSLAVSFIISFVGGLSRNVISQTRDAVWKRQEGLFSLLASQLVVAVLVSLCAFLTVFICAKSIMPVAVVSAIVAFVGIIINAIICAVIVNGDKKVKR